LRLICEVEKLFLFIFESIGMQELILIGAIALIVFGPRKLPQMARTVGKMMAEFRKATSDFKETWEKEVDFEEFKETSQMKPVSGIEKTIAKEDETKPAQIAEPEIKEIKQEDFEKIFPPKDTEKDLAEQTSKVSTGKQNWL
jgi:Tat protein translocase TatB subunit